MATVDVLMSTYNGETYVREQIRSILDQSQSDIRLLVRDDGSTDKTRQILASYAAQDPRIVLIDDAVNLGAAHSFVKLLRYVESEYFMFSDQDDVWLPNKIQITLEALRHEEDGAPRLVFTDLFVVDRALENKAHSFMKYQKFDPIKGSQFSRLLLQNVVVGCTLGGNRALLVKSELTAEEPPLAMLMHDWWLALVASAFGSVRYIESATILYRQHGANVVGASGSSFRRYIEMVFGQRPWRRAREYFTKVVAQCAEFDRRYGDRLDAEAKVPLAAIVTCARHHPGLRLLGLYRCGIMMNGALRNIALFLSLSTWMSWAPAGDD